MLSGLIANPLKGSPSEVPAILTQYSVLGQQKSSKAECMATIKETIWITYRSNFPELMESNHISDTGWGCMIRVGQMLLASALRRYQLNHFEGALDITSILTCTAAEAFSVSGRRRE